MDEVAEAHPESSSANKVRLTAATFFFVLSITPILTACSGLQTRTFDRIGQDGRFMPDTIQVSDGETVRINFSNPGEVSHWTDLPDFNPHIALIPGGESPLEILVDQAASFLSCVRGDMKRRAWWVH